MKHKISQNKLSRGSSQRKALLRNLVTDTIKHGRITTTKARAKEARPLVEKMITIAKNKDFNSIRKVSEFILDKKVRKEKNFEEFLKKNCVINVGSGQELTIKKFAELISRLTLGKLKLKFNKKYPDGTKRKILDNTILKKFGWKPKISLKDGLENTIKWYVENSN